MSVTLITGGAGFIGCNYVYHRLETTSDRLIVYDALTYAGNLESLDSALKSGRVVFVRGDVNDEDLLARAILSHEVDTVVHFAAESHVDRSVFGPDAFIRSNINGTYGLLKSLLTVKQRDGLDVRLHHVSTDEVYGSLGAEDPAFTENSPFRPNSPYSASKAASDCLVRSFVSTFDLRATVSHCSNNYGPFQFPEKLIPKVIISFLAGRAIGVYGSGMQIRDWIDVKDHCRGIDLCLEKGETGEFYNLGACCEKTNLDLISAVGEALRDLLSDSARLRGKYPACLLAEEPFAPDSRFIEHVADRQGHDFRYALSPDFAAKRLGFRARSDFDEALRRTALWYLENDAWWRRLVQMPF